jgi:hypothetical protein
MLEDIPLTLNLLDAEKTSGFEDVNIDSIDLPFFEFEPHAIDFSYLQIDDHQFIARGIGQNSQMLLQETETCHI